MSPPLLDDAASRYFTWRELLHAGETWEALRQVGAAPSNLPLEPRSWSALRTLSSQLLDPLFERFGALRITYGFAGPELIRHIKRRARAERRGPRIDPSLDQHAACERKTRTLPPGEDRAICPRGGAAIDFLVPGQPSGTVADWIAENLPFDRLYVYGDDRPLHLSHAPAPAGLLVDMIPAAGGRLRPQVRRRG